LITFGNQFSNNNAIKVTTSAATNVDWYLSGYERKAGDTKTEFSRDNQITTATTTTLYTSSAAGIKVTMNYLSITNLDAVNPNTITVIYYDGTLNIQLHKAVLAAGEKLEYVNGGFA